MNAMDLKQRLMMFLGLLSLVSLLFSPLYTIVLLAISFVLKKRGNNKLKLIACIGGGVFTILIVYLIFTSGWDGIVAASPDSLADWIFGLSSWRLLFPFVCFTGSVFATFENADKMLLKAEEKRLSKNYRHISQLDMDAKTHLGSFGTTGSGKTTADLIFVEDSIKNGEPLYIISGKNGTDDPRSLLNITKALARKYHRILYVISLNPREKDRLWYNPFQYMTPTEVSDTLVTISDYTEPHYKESTKAWILAVAECLKLGGISFSLNSICDFYEYDKFAELVTHLVDTGKLTKEAGRHYLGMKYVADEAALSISRFRNLLMGDGKEVFGDGIDCISATQAREDNAIFFVDLDSFSYTDFTMAVGRLVIGDLRHIIATETNMDRKKRIIMDELGAYATDALLPLFSQARSYGYQVIISTQSIADLENISETFAERLLENCGQYLVLQLNSSKDAETMANIIGTRMSIETTRKSSGALLDGSASGTKKIVHEYKCPVDDLKELRPLQAIYYNKRTPDIVYKVTLDFIDI